MADLGLKYYDVKHPGSFAGIDKFYRSQTEASRKQIRDWTKGQEAYTLLKPVRYHFPRPQVVTSGLDFQWDADLMEMTTYAPDNDGYSYILVAVDILSHFAWSRPLKTKSGREVAKAFRSIFQNGRLPSSLRTDKGSEFIGVLTQKVFKQFKIKHFVTHDITKANYIERFIRTLRLRLGRYFIQKETHRWIDNIQNFTAAYNASYHRSIKRAPKTVDHQNEADVWLTQYGTPRPLPDQKDFKFQVGTYVRIAHLRRTFQKEQHVRWTTEVFKIKSHSVKDGLNAYKLEDFLDEPVKGSLFEPELQEVTIDPTGVFKIDKVVRSRKRRGVEKEYLVSYRGWPSKFNSWVKQSDMQDI